jgi:sugar phosphate isomerase/epimerase
MKVLFSTGALYGLPFLLAFRLAAAAGFDGVELVLDPLAILAGPAAVLRTSVRFRQPIVALHPSLFGLPGLRGPCQLARQLASWARAIEPELLVLHPPRCGKQATTEQEFDWTLELLRESLDAKVRITVENTAVFLPQDRLNPYVWPPNVAAFARARQLGMTFDTTHVASTGLEVISAYEGVAAQVEHVHLSDYRVPKPLLDRPSLDTYCKHHQMPGVGELDVPGFLAALRAHGYDGAITVEVSPLAVPLWRWRKTVHALAAVVSTIKACWTCEANHDTAC